MDITTRLSELKQWYNYKEEHIDWLINCFESMNMPTPLIYSSSKDDIRAEWRKNDYDISLDIYLESKVGYWHFLNHKTGDCADRNFDLNNHNQWKEISDLVCRSFS